MSNRTYGRSAPAKDFSDVPRAHIERSTFDRSHGHKTTMNAGFVTPIFLDEVLPGDTFDLKTSAFGRLTTPIFPLMDNVNFSTHFFFIPNRIVWKNWVKLQGEQDNPGDSIDFTTPQVKFPKIKAGTLQDYMGLPIGVSTTDFKVSALPFRAYNKVFNDWFRLENFQNSQKEYTDDQDDDQIYYTLQRSAKKHDYFTSALKAPQKGTSTFAINSHDLQVVSTTRRSGDAIPDREMSIRFLNASNNMQDGHLVQTGGDKVKLVFDNGSKNYANTDQNVQLRSGKNDYAVMGMRVDSRLTGSITTTVNDLRNAFAIQRILEADARGGTRYFEIIQNLFGVTSPDSRLQRSEYLGGGKSRLDVFAVSQNSATDSTSPQGNLSSFATVEFHNHGFKRSFVEHGHILGVIIIRADVTYQNGLNRLWSRKTRYDYYLPAFAHLGEQAILNKEIYCSGVPDWDDKAWGYQERNSEYRYKPSTIGGMFNSRVPNPLDAWHLSQHFAELPALSLEFLQDDPPFARVVAVPSEHHFMFDFHFTLKCTRPIPARSVPGLNDHF